MAGVSSSFLTKKSRQITEFPAPWDYGTTPYALNEFTPCARSLSDLANATQLERLSSSSGRSSASIPVRMAKAVFVGDVGVGKTSIINRFCRDIFQPEYKATIGIDYEMERFWILNIPFNLQIWDTAGQERYACIASSYYRGSNIVVTVFDASNMETLSTCQRWMDDAVGANTRQGPLKFLVGTKFDLVNQAHRDKIHQMGLRMANLMEAEYWPLSSKSGENVEIFFRRIGTLALETSLANEAREDIKEGRDPLVVMEQREAMLVRPSISDQGEQSSRCSSCRSN